MQPNNVRVLRSARAQLVTRELPTPIPSRYAPVTGIATVFAVLLLGVALCPVVAVMNAPTTSTGTTITVARGDGIGPEVMDATLRILEAAKAPLRYEPIELGQSVYERGFTAGIEPTTWSTIRRNRILLKAPITTPQGGGFKSLNVTIRKTLNMFANVRPTKSYAPYVASPHPGMNLVVIRENEEDLYAGIEHRQTDEVAQVLKLITVPGTERIVRYAFEYARAYGRRRVTCMTKDNIMKLTDGLFHRVFREIAAEYDDIESDHQIIDIGAARLAAQPEQFDVIVTLNLYGDILSDIASQVAGSVGLAGSANIGDGGSDVRSGARLRTRYCRQRGRQPFRVAAGSDADVGASRRRRRRTTHQERLVVHARKRHPHRRFLPLRPE